MRLRPNGLKFVSLPQRRKDTKFHKAFVLSARGSFVSWCLSGIFALAVQSCNPPELKHPAPAINTIKAGEKFCVILPENHAEAFVWRLDQTKKKAVDYVNAVWHGNEKGIYYHFKAQRAGQDTLNFVLYKFDEKQKYTSYIVKVE